MKKLLALLSVIFLGLGTALAQSSDKILVKIQETNASLKNVECTFTRTRTLPAASKITKEDGDLYFSAPDRLAMIYKNPKESLIINGNTLFMRRAGKPSTFDTGKSSLMGSLRNMLLDCITGNVRKVAQENNADIVVKEAKGFYNVTLSSRETAVKGYSKIFLTYRKSDCLLVRMETIEYAGISEVYLMDGFKTVAAIDAEKFTIPKK